MTYEAGWVGPGTRGSAGNAQHPPSTWWPDAEDRARYEREAAYVIAVMSEGYCPGCRQRLLPTVEVATLPGHTVACGDCPPCHGAYFLVQDAEGHYGWEWQRTMWPAEWLEARW